MNVYMHKIRINGRKIEIELDQSYYERVMQDVKESREDFRKDFGEPLKSFEYWYNTIIEDVINDGLNVLFARITKDDLESH